MLGKKHAKRIAKQAKKKNREEVYGVKRTKKQKMCTCTEGTVQPTKEQTVVEKKK